MPVTMGAEKEVPEAAVYRSSPGNVVLESVGEYVGERSLVNNTPAKATCITADW